MNSCVVEDPTFWLGVLIWYAMCTNGLQIGAEAYLSKAQRITLAIVWPIVLFTVGTWEFFKWAFNYGSSGTS